jgi:N6-adenosine-specific RNA methylase IME4
MRYRTIVADPPWSYPEGWPVGSENGRVSPHAARRGVPFEHGRRTPLRYAQLSLDAIRALPVGDLAQDDAHLYLWTTNRYLPAAFDVLAAWGFRYSQTLVWAKTPMGKGPGGIWAQNVEYILFARRGSLGGLQRFDSCWFGWKRMGKAHSRKPDAMLDMVEQASPGPYVELFSRRMRFGWDYVWHDADIAPVAQAG